MKSRSLHLRRREPVHRGVIRLVKGLTGAAIRGVDKPSRNRGEDIHRARVTIKFLRALLRLLQPVADQSFLAQNKARLHAAGARLAGFRDATVSREVLHKLIRKTKKQRDRQAMERVLTALTAASRSEARTRLRQERALQQTANDLSEVRQVWRGLHLSAKGWAALAPGFRRTYRQGRKLMMAAKAEGAPKDYHKWRKRVRDLHFQLKLLPGVRGKKISKMDKRLKTLAELLGDENDLAVLERRLLQPGRFPAMEEEIALTRERLRSRAACLRPKIAEIGDRCFQFPPQALLKRLATRWKK